MNKIKDLQKMIDEVDNIVFFGGAGVSTDSGIKDFRGKNGLYKMKLKYPADVMLSSTMFYNDPEEFYKFYKENLNSLDVLPNATHNYLTKLEKQGKLKAIVTQNIDGLHQKSGSKNVYEIHGSILKNHCLKCHNFFDGNYVFKSEGVPTCDECGGLIKPDVILYGESLPDCFNEAIEKIINAQMLIVAGTSLTVEPASSLVNLFKGKYLVIINNEKTRYDYKANLVINDNLKKVFKELK